MAQPARDPVADHRVPHGLADDEPDPGGAGRGSTEPSDLFGRDRMNDEPGPAHSPTLPGHQPKIVATGQSCGRGEHASQADRRLRPLPRRAARIARPARVRMRSRNPWVRDRRRLFGWKVRLLTVDLPVLARQVICPRRRPASRPQRPVLPSDGAQNSPTPRGRPYEATHPRPAGSIRVPVRPPDDPPDGRSATRRTREMLASEHILWHSAALVSVRALGWPDGSGSPRCAAQVMTDLRRALAAVRRTFVHSCGQPCGCFP